MGQTVPKASTNKPQKTTKARSKWSNPIQIDLPRESHMPLATNIEGEIMMKHKNKLGTKSLIDTILIHICNNGRPN